MSAKILKTDSKGCNKIQKGARIPAIGQAMKTRRMIPIKRKHIQDENKAKDSCQDRLELFASWGDEDSKEGPTFLLFFVINTYNRASSTDFQPWLSNLSLIDLKVSDFLFSNFGEIMTLVLEIFGS